MIGITFISVHLLERAQNSAPTSQEKLSRIEVSVLESALNAESSALEGIV